MFSFYVLVAYMQILFNEKKQIHIDAVDQIYKTETCFNLYINLKLQRFINLKFYFEFSKNFT